jgi:FkbM family methyltransferase
LRAEHRRVLVAPWKFWAALALKLVPGAWPWPIDLELRQGGRFAVREFMTLYIYTEIFVHRCYDAGLAADLGAQPQIADVGANTGLFVVRARQLHPRGHVVAFEPLRANHQALRETLAMSGIDDVDARDEGVGGTARSERLYIHPRNLGGHSIVSGRGVSGTSVDIRLIDVRQMLESLGGRCDLLKLDCEGAEWEIVRSITPREAACIRHMLIEPTPQLYDVEELVARLRALGYEVRFERDVFVAEFRGAPAQSRGGDATVRVDSR